MDRPLVPLGGRRGAGRARSLAAVRSATPPSPIVATGNAPFASGPWLFSLNGFVAGFRGRSASSSAARSPRGGPSASRARPTPRCCSPSCSTSSTPGVARPRRSPTSPPRCWRWPTGKLNLLLGDGRDHHRHRLRQLALHPARQRARRRRRARGVRAPRRRPRAGSAVPDGSAVLATRDQGGVLPLAPSEDPRDRRPPSPIAAPSRSTSAPTTSPRRSAGTCSTGSPAARKHLPPKWFYDERGSDLFDEITRLEEYYPTRRETEILAREAAAIARRTGATTLLELGSGTSTKTRLLLDGARRGRARSSGSCRSTSASPCCATAGPELAAAYPGVRVDAVVGRLRAAPRAGCPMEGTTLVAFLGGTIGNLAPPERAKFLGELSDQLQPGDWLLLGTDLVKDPARLVRGLRRRAPASPPSSTATSSGSSTASSAGDLVPERFAHVARWDPDEQWIEMHLRSEGDQQARLAALDLDLELRRRRAAPHRDQRQVHPGPHRGRAGRRRPRARPAPHRRGRRLRRLPVPQAVA